MMNFGLIFKLPAKDLRDRGKLAMPDLHLLSPRVRLLMQLGMENGELFDQKSTLAWKMLIFNSCLFPSKDFIGRN